jgi:HSP20 family protein
MQTIQQEMNRLFGTLFDAPEGSGRGGDGGSMRRWIPAMDLVEEGDHFVLRADLPGVRDEDVNVELEDNVLTISGERKAEQEDRKEGYYRVERAVGRFSRSLTLPEGVDPDSIEAHFDNGVLTVRIPKPQQRQPRRVAIGVGGKAPTIEGSGRQGQGSGAEGSTGQRGEREGRSADQGRGRSEQRSQDDQGRGGSERRSQDDQGRGGSEQRSQGERSSVGGRS